jgi:hypothetical protein
MQSRQELYQRQKQVTEGKKIPYFLMQKRLQAGADMHQIAALSVVMQTHLVFYFSVGLHIRGWVKKVYLYTLVGTKKLMPSAF